MVEILAYAGGTSRNPYFAAASNNPFARAAANGILQSGPATNYGPATVISFGDNDITLAPATYNALGAGGGAITADQAYIRANSDVAAAIANGQFRTGLEHYLLYGASEGRFYAGVGVQTLSAEQLYLEENPDVVNAVQSGGFRSGLEHYLLYGASEGRYYHGQSMRSITPEELYLRDNRDVANAVRAGIFRNGLDHFHKHGRAEGRFYYGHSQGPAQRIYVPTVRTSRNGAAVSLNPDQQYLSSNPEAARAVAVGRYRDGLQYFIGEGYASGGSYRSLQGWRLNSPAERGYLKANPDVAEAVASGVLPSGEDHFFTYGKNESFRACYGQLTNAAYNANTIEGGYLRANRDAALALANGRNATGLDYFLTVGAGRGQSYGAITAARLDPAGERQYLAANRDAANAVAAGQSYRSGLEHFLAIGYAEGRNYGNLTGASLTSGPSAALDRVYLKAHPDAANALAAGQFDSAFAYFVTLGARRGDSYGRLTIASLGDSNERNYLTRNKDVAAAVAAGIYASGLDHFIFNGYAEGRGDFGSLRAESLTDPALGKLEAAYLQQNRDVARAVVSGQFGSGLAHFLTFGGSEGRRYGALQASLLSSSGLEAAYIAGNADAAAAIATGQAASGLDFFLKTGIDKGQRYGRLSAADLGGVNDPERRYLARFQDVAKAVAEGAMTSGLDHYLAYGHQDRPGVNYGKLTAGMLNPNSLEGQYLQTRRAAADAVARGQVANALDYFLKTGVDRGEAYGQLSAANIGATGPAERAYLFQNQDVANAVSLGIFPSGLDHFLKQSWTEDRRYGTLRAETLRGSPAADSELAYLRANPDVAAQVAAGSFASGLEHYFKHGRAEERTGYGNLSTGTLNAAGLEGDYLRANSLALQAVATGAAKSGLDYFLRVGVNEGHRYGKLTAERLAGATNEPERLYLTRYRDVAAAVAEGSFASGLIHYLSAGKAEGRIYEGQAGADLPPVTLDPAARDSWYLVGSEAAYRAVATGAAKSGLEYFLTVGVDKGDTYGQLNRARLGEAGSLERQYLLRNLDVAAAVAEGGFASGVAHYLAWGYKEGRQAYGKLGEDALLKSDAGEGVREAEARYLLDHADVLEGVLKGRIGSGFEEWQAAGIWNGRGYGGITRDTLLAAIAQDADRYVNSHPKLVSFIKQKFLTSSERTELAIQHFAMTGFEHGETLFGLSKDRANTLVRDSYKPGEIPNLPLFGTLGFQLGAIPGAIASLLEGNPREIFALILTLFTTDGLNCGSKYNNGTRNSGSQPDDTARAVSPFDTQCNRHDCVYEEALGDGTDKNPGKIGRAKNEIRDAEKEISKLKLEGAIKSEIEKKQAEIEENKKIIAEQEAKVRVADIALAGIAIKDVFTNLGQSIYAPLEAVYKLAAAVLFTVKAGGSLGMTLLEHLKDDALKAASKLWEGVTGVVKDFWTLASDAVSRLVGAAGNFFSEVGKALETIAKTVGSVFDHIGQAISGFFGGGQPPGAGDPASGAGDPASGAGDPASGADDPASGAGDPASGAGDPASDDDE